MHIDFVGPFPDGGYILVIVSTFTCWIELYHTLDAAALSAAECLLKHFGRFGAPSQLRSDNWPQSRQHYQNLGNTDILALSTDSVPTTLLRTAFSLDRQQASYRDSKGLLCASSTMIIDLLALQDGSSA